MSAVIPSSSAHEVPAHDVPAHEIPAHEVPVVAAAPGLTRRIEAAASRARRFAATQAGLLDIVAAATLAGFAVFSVRYVDITIRDERQKIAAARRVARAALTSGGQTATDARALLARLDFDLFRLPPIALYGLALAATVPLLRRRASPMTVGLVVLGSCAALSWYSPADTTVPALSACLALYSIAAYARHAPFTRWLLSIVAVTVLAALMSGAIHRGDVPDQNLPLRDIVYGASFVVLILLSALSFGEITRRHRQALRDLERHAALLAAQQDALARTAILDERVRIARELHDVVAHHVSVMGVQAGAARLRLAADASGDEKVRAALSSIEQSSRQAVDDLHHLVGFLRSDGGGGSLVSPQPSLAELDALVADHRNSGLDIATYVTGDLGAVPAGVGLAAYRIVQEALTNVRKHAASCRTATLRLDVTNETLRLAVHNSAAGPSTAGVAASGGHGIVGMRERAALHGGTVRAQPSNDGGFVVRAELPMRSREVTDVPGRANAVVRVVICDDQPLVRAGLRMIIETQPSMLVVGEGANGLEAVSLAASLTPDVMIMDIQMPSLDGIEATRRVVALDPPVPMVLVLTTFERDDYLHEALRAGASGFLLKNSPPERLLDALSIVAAGDSLVDPAMTRRLLDAFSTHLPRAVNPLVSTLTDRELDVLRSVARGWSNAEIGERLFIGESTVKTHVSSVLVKLGLRDRVQAVVFAYENGVVSPGA